jgi:hypothetical protein
MAATTCPAFDFKDPAAWQAAHDYRIKEGLAELVDDRVARASGGMDHIVREHRGRWYLHAAACLAAGRRSLRDGNARALLDRVLYFPFECYNEPAGRHELPFVGSPITLAEFEAGVALAASTGRVLVLADGVGLGAEVRSAVDTLLAVPGQVRPEAARLVGEDLAWTFAFVETHRADFRVLAFYETESSLWSLVRVALGLLETFRHGPLPKDPAAKPAPGRPVDPARLLALALEVVLFPETPSAKEVLAQWTGARTPGHLKRVSGVARKALGVEDWPPVREVIARLLRASGDSWTLEIPPTGDAQAMESYRSSVAVLMSKTRASIPKADLVLGAAEVALVRSGVLAAVLGHRAERHIRERAPHFWVERNSP